jgi:hypothetical protein
MKLDYRLIEMEDKRKVLFERQESKGMYTRSCFYESETSGTETKERD